jgi:hypothetical protein
VRLVSALESSCPPNLHGDSDQRGLGLAQGHTAQLQETQNSHPTLPPPVHFHPLILPGL